MCPPVPKNVPGGTLTSFAVASLNVAEPLGWRFAKLWTASTASALGSGLATIAYVVGFMLFAFGVHAALWTIVGNSLRQRLTPPEMLGRVASTSLFIAAGGNCVGAVLGGVIAARFGITAPYWAGFVVAVIVSATTWRVFNRATVAQAYAEPALTQ